MRGIRILLAKRLALPSQFQVQPGTIKIVASLEEGRSVLERLQVHVPHWRQTSKADGRSRNGNDIVDLVRDAGRGFESKVVASEAIELGEKG